MSNYREIFSPYTPLPYNNRGQKPHSKIRNSIESYSSGAESSRIRRQEQENAEYGRRVEAERKAWDKNEEMLKFFGMIGDVDTSPYEGLTPEELIEQLTLYSNINLDDEFPKFIGKYQKVKNVFDKLKTPPYDTDLLDRVSVLSAIYEVFDIGTKAELYGGSKSRRKKRRNKRKTRR